ncbi:hypothetical protein H9P43_001699 [Blastocladiella emersonii ATCC 22665]|nr:hypothetical protein H9P43_001699 [Blastocladiella emersonii ATCC 22665]
MDPHLVKMYAHALPSHPCAPPLTCDRTIPACSLVIGNVSGNLDKLAAKLPSLHKQAGFSHVFCAGRFLAKETAATGPNPLTDQLLAGELAFPCPVYFTAGNVPLPQRVLDAITAADTAKDGSPVQLAPNVYYLGTTGAWTAPDGLRVAFIGGSWVPTKFNAAPDAAHPEMYHTAQLEALCSPDVAPVDLLISFDAPQRMSPASAGPLKTETPVLNAVVQHLRPRYHLCGGPATFYERAPYAHASGSEVTRFLSLAAFGNVRKEKWVYAFKIRPLAHKPAGNGAEAVPANTTVNPFTAESLEAASALFVSPTPAPAPTAAAGAKRAHPDGDAEPAAKRARNLGDDARPQRRERDPRDEQQQPGKPGPSYICRICKEPGHYITDCPSKSDAPVDPARSCWFCVESPNAEKSLIFAVGAHAYGAVAKGSLTPHHLIVASTPHVQHWHRSANTSAAQLAQASAMAEVTKFAHRAAQVFERNGRVPVTFQIARTMAGGGAHAHMQMIPATPDQAASVAAAMLAKLQDADHAHLNLTAHRIAVPATDARSLPTALEAAHRQDPNAIRFTDNHVAVLAGTDLVFVPLPRGARFPAQLPREVIGTVLGEVAKAKDWRAGIDEAAEAGYARELAEAFRDLHTVEVAGINLPVPGAAAAGGEAAEEGETKE